MKINKKTIKSLFFKIIVIAIVLALIFSVFVVIIR
jgi:hypothetical protein